MARKPKPATFGAALRRLREEQGWTAYRLAKEAGLPIQTVLRIEEGAAGPWWPTVLKLADALGVSTEAFRDKATGRGKSNTPPA